MKIVAALVLLCAMTGGWATKPILADVADDAASLSDIVDSLMQWPSSGRTPQNKSIEFLDEFVNDQFRSLIAPTFSVGFNEFRIRTATMAEFTDENRKYISKKLFERVTLDAISGGNRSVSPIARAMAYQEEAIAMSGNSRERAVYSIRKSVDGLMERRKYLKDARRDHQEGAKLYHDQFRTAACLIKSVVDLDQRIHDAFYDKPRTLIGLMDWSLCPATAQIDVASGLSSDLIVQYTDIIDNVYAQQVAMSNALRHSSDNIATVARVFETERKNVMCLIATAVATDWPITEQLGDIINKFDFSIEADYCQKIVREGSALAATEL